MWESKRGKEGLGESIRKVEFAGLNLPLLVVVCALEDRPAPFADQTLCDALDAGLGALAARVEVDDLADSAAEEDFLVDRQPGERVEDVALDVVGWETAVVERLKEVLNGLKEVGLGVEDRVLNRGSVEERCDLGEQLKLVCCSHSLFAGIVVGDAGLLHGDLEVCDLIIDCVFEVLHVSS